MATDRAQPHRQWPPPGRALRRAIFGVLLLLVLLLAVIRLYPAAYVYPTLPKVTRTSQGAPGDPLNVLAVGSRSQLVAGFMKAGWLAPDPITSASSARIVADSLTRRPYPTAPVSNLYVFGRVQDIAFEWPTNDVQNRGHIRLWQTSVRLAGQPLWLGAASYDQGIELSGRTGFPTHHILPTVDLERDTVGANLAHTGLGAAETYTPFTPPIFAARNGGGDYYASDGDVLVVSFVPAALPAPTGLAAADAVIDRGLFRGYDAILVAPVLAVTVILIGVGLLVLAFWPVLAWTWRRLRLGGTDAAD